MAASAAASAEWDAFADREPAAAKVTYERLSQEPLVRIPGRQFPLRGRGLKPFWEFEASPADRVYYAVHLTDQTVIVACCRDVHTGAKVGALIKNRRGTFGELPVPALEPAAVTAPLRKPKREGV
jgi:hypothetical protein